VCATRQSTAASYEMAVIVGFHCDVISCELSWPKPAAATESSACECGNVVGLTSIHDKMQFFQLCGQSQDQLSLATLRGRQIAYQLCPGKSGNVTSVGWQVTLCDPAWRVSSRSGMRPGCKRLHSVNFIYVYLPKT